ncbi:hypothetical protein A7Y44_21430, partial [Salmonella enterica subsp. enterica serovar Enteritidis]|nr:hypothetical protein [Salmonella enterica subsp. enterica serovar Enteritidis]EEB6816160.1 hypothetical protein [Salmonella enterica]
ELCWACRTSRTRTILVFTGEIMKNRIFLPLLLVLSATAFSASAMAASDSKPPPDNTKSASSGLPPIPAPFIRPPFCDNWPPDIEKPPEWCQICGC